MRISDNFMLVIEDEPTGTLLPVPYDVKGEGRWAFYMPISQETATWSCVQRAVDLFRSCSRSIGTFKTILLVEHLSGIDELSLKDMGYLGRIYAIMKDYDEFKPLMKQGDESGWVIGVDIHEGLEVFTYLTEKQLNNLLAMREEQGFLSQEIGQPIDVTEIFNKFKKGGGSEN